MNAGSCCAGGGDAHASAVDPRGEPDPVQQRPLEAPRLSLRIRDVHDEEDPGEDLAAEREVREGLLVVGAAQDRIVGGIRVALAEQEVRRVRVRREREGRGAGRRGGREVPDGNGMIDQLGRLERLVEPRRGGRTEPEDPPRRVEDLRVDADPHLVAQRVGDLVEVSRRRRERGSDGRCRERGVERREGPSARVLGPEMRSPVEVQRRITRRVGDGPGGVASQDTDVVREHPEDELLDEGIGKRALDVAGGEARRAQEGDEQIGAVQRVAGPAPEGAARAAQRPPIDVEPDLVPNEGEDLRRVVTERGRPGDDHGVGGASRPAGGDRRMHSAAAARRDARAEARGRAARAIPADGAVPRDANRWTRSPGLPFPCSSSRRADSLSSRRRGQAPLARSRARLRPLSLRDGSVPLSEELEFFRDLGVRELFLDAPEVPVLVPGSMRTLPDLQKFIAGCPRCKLAPTRTQIVFGQGNPEGEAHVRRRGARPGRGRTGSGVRRPRRAAADQDHRGDGDETGGRVDHATSSNAGLPTTATPSRTRSPRACPFSRSRFV